MKNLILYLFISLLIILGCKNHDHLTSNCDTVSFTGEILDTLRTSEYFKKGNLIKLETTNESLLKRIKKVRHFRNHLIIQSGKSLYFFDTLGNYQYKIHNVGKGPGEYLAIRDFQIYKPDSIIEILDFHGKKIVRYEINGTYLDEWKHGFFVQQFNKITDNIYAFYCGSHITGNSSNRLLFVKKNSNKILNSFFTITENEAWYLYIIDNVNFFNIDKKIYFTYSSNDTLYQIKSTSVMPVKSIDLGVNKIPTQFYDRKYDDILEFMQTFNKRNYIGLTDNYYAFDKKYFFSAMNGDSLNFFIMDMKSNKITKFKRLMDDILLNGWYWTPNYQNVPVGGDNHSIYFSLEPTNITVRTNGMNNNIKNDILKKLGTFTIKDNPYLLIYNF
ncbi:MAG: 6-bladed beta-propeller [Bacteroidetes bacterium]|nr:6-bladed beta-propeller [Bacteroidota bacterium]